MSTQNWNGITGGMKKYGSMYGNVPLAINFKPRVRCLSLRIYDGEGSSRPTIVTLEMEEIVRNLS